jgi:hypothetical protein
MLGNYRVFAQLVDSRILLSSTDLVSLLGGVRLCPLGRSVTIWPPIVPASDDG